MKNEKMDFTPVLDLIKLAESRGHEFNDPNAKAAVVAGFTVIAAFDKNLPVEMKLKPLQSTARLAIGAIIGEVSNDVLEKVDIVVSQMLESCKNRNI